MSGMAAIATEMVLRRATVQDAKAIAKVRIDSWRTTYRGIIPDTYLDEMELDDSTAIWLRILTAPANNTTAVFVAEQDGEVIGFSAGMLLPEEKFGCNAELTAIYLKPDIQRRGIGRRMMRMVVDVFQSQGATGMLVWVLTDNKPARQFYESLGGELLTEQSFTWDDLDLKEAAYGWRDLDALMVACDE